MKAHSAQIQVTVLKRRALLFAFGDLILRLRIVGDFMRGREIGGVPAAANGLDEQGAGGHAPRADRDRVQFVVQLGGLGGDDGEIILRTGLVLVGGDVERLSGRLDRWKAVRTVSR